MSVWNRYGRVGVVIASFAIVACGGGENNTAPAADAASSPLAAAAATAATARTENPCPLTVDQVAAITGEPMTQPAGGCTFFPANGRDIPHVFYVLQVPMMCTSIQPSELGFTEPVSGLPSAFVRDAIDGTHVMVCRNNGRAFDVVVDLKNDKARNRDAAITLATQLAAR